MDAPDILYNYPGISAMAESIGAFVVKLDNDLDALDAQYKALIANGWHGAGADAFGACSTQWNAGAKGCSAALAKLKAATGESGVTMQGTDGRVAARFGG